MRRLLITTACRKAKFDEPSGHLYVVDLDNWKVTQRGSIIEPPYREIDPNPRGGFRGGKGIAIFENQIIMANSVCAFRFNKNWELLRIISHPSCSGIHDILIDSDHNLYVTSARNDLLFKFDLDGNLIEYYYFRQNPANHAINQWVRPEILSIEEIAGGQIDFRDPRTHKITSHDSVHINSISQLPDGSLLTSLGLVVGSEFSLFMEIKDQLSKYGLWPWIIRANQYIRNFFSFEKEQHSDLIIQPAKGKSIVVRIFHNGDIVPCLVLEQATVPGHSILARSDGTAIYLNTSFGNIIHFKPENGRIISKTKVSTQFLRGIVHLSDDEIIVGSQNNLLWFSLQTREIRKQITLSDNLNEAVFSIHEFPETFSLPPISFESQLGKLVGFNEKEAIFKLGNQ
jgi:hypothetical protein